ncbi:MAG: UDP-N-acetylmuramate dehydrogenase [Clostridia bacterium]|nr:UDP-N-acetylmuramate dehydrogenase [Clostridia bacterium]
MSAAGGGEPEAWAAWAARLGPRLAGRVTAREPLSRHTTLKVGGPAGLYVVPADLEDLRRAVAWLEEAGLAWRVIGLGSNLLVPDEGFAGAVLTLQRAANWIEFQGTRVRVGAGFPLARLVQETAKRGLAGTVGLAGIPGSVGGALAMNAGTPRGEMKDVLESCLYLTPDGRLVEAGPDELGFAYRRTAFLDPGRRWIAVAAVLRLSPAPAESLRAELREYLAHRNATQPVELPNTGSVFTNPPGRHAGRLIEEAGLKGERLGDAQISPKHANFIVNLGQARMAEVVALMRRARERVRETAGIVLEPEVRWLCGQEELRRLLDGPAPHPASRAPGAGEGSRAV